MHPGVIEPLSINVGPNVKCLHAAVSDVFRRNVRIWISGFNIYEEPEGGWESLEKMPGAMKSRGEANRGRGFAEVDFITLDKFCEDMDLLPDLIKIDVEGYQAKAVIGVMETVWRHRPVIVIELHDPEKLQRFGTTNMRTVAPLFEAGYRGYWCGEHRSAAARFTPLRAIGDMDEAHEKLSLMVMIP